ncbi:uncharacterized protein MCAP_0864-like [Clytia hemisphaerica]
MRDLKLVFLFHLGALLIEVTSGQGLMNILSNTNTAPNALEVNDNVAIKLSQLAPRTSLKQQKRRSGRRALKNKKANTEPPIVESNMDESLIVESLNVNKQPASTTNTKSIDENTSIRERIAQTDKQVDQIAKEVRGYKAQINSPTPIFNEDFINLTVNKLKERKKKLKEFAATIEEWLDIYQNNQAIVNMIKALLKKVKALCKQIEEQIDQWECLLKKKTLLKEIELLENKYKQFYDQFKNIKDACQQKEFNKNCIEAYLKMKGTLTKFQQEIKQKIEKLLSRKCLTDKQKVPCYQRLLKLQSKVSGLIEELGNCLKQMFVDKIGAINKIRNDLYNKISLAKLKVEGSSNKKLILEAINNLKKYHEELQKLKEELEIVIDCFNKIAKCLTPEDYEKCKHALDDLRMELKGLCKLVQDCLENLQKLLTILPLQQDMNKKKKEIEKLQQQYNVLFTGLTFNCTTFKKILSKLESLQKEAEECKSKVQQLSNEIEYFADCPKYKEMKATLSEMQENLMALCENIKNMIFVFTVIIKLFCK